MTHEASVGIFFFFSNITYKTQGPYLSFLMSPIIYFYLNGFLHDGTISLYLRNTCTIKVHVVYSVKELENAIH